MSNLMQSVEMGEIKSFEFPEKTIETVFAKLFFYKNKVIKVYKYKDVFGLNFRDPSFRKKFCTEDFLWNKIMAPDVYIKLGGVKATSGGFVLCGTDVAEDFFIEMVKIDSSRNLTNLLMTQELLASDIKKITTTFLKRLRDLTKKQRNKYSQLFDRGWFSIQEKDLNDVYSFLETSARKYIPIRTSKKIVNLLSRISEKEKYFINHDRRFLTVGIDNNSDNILYFKGKTTFIDVMPPKEEWRVYDEAFLVSRTATDCYALGNKSLGDMVYETYSKYRMLPPPNVKLAYEIRRGLVQWAYRHVIKRHDEAEKFKHFTLSKVAEILESGTFK